MLQRQSEIAQCLVSHSFYQTTGGPIVALRVGVVCMHRAGGGQQRWGRWYSILRSEGEEQAGSRRPKDGNRASDAWRSGGWAGEEDVSGRAKKRRGLFVGVEAWESGGRWCGRPEDNGRGGVGMGLAGEL
ncbi:hypothetical protein GW17_00026420 [Ensete ventricosum]|nr:hypothetical protein GW17_00026420 [Ensete ventricosum]